MGYIEETIIGWINADEDRLHDFINLLVDHEQDEAPTEALLDKLLGQVPACGKFWQDLLLAAIVEADWEQIATQITDRRGANSDDGAWVMLDRRNS